MQTSRLRASHARHSQAIRGELDKSRRSQCLGHLTTLRRCNAVASGLRVAHASRVLARRLAATDFHCGQPNLEGVSEKSAIARTPSPARRGTSPSDWRTRGTRALPRECCDSTEDNSTRFPLRSLKRNFAVNSARFPATEGILPARSRSRQIA
jgi:hypothetical protein